MTNDNNQGKNQGTMQDDEEKGGRASRGGSDQGGRGANLTHEDRAKGGRNTQGGGKNY